MALGRFRILYALAAVLCILFSGCGGGGEGSQSQSTGAGAQTPTLAWDPPQTYVDNTPMDPYKELDYYEFYVSRYPNFTDNAVPVAQVAAITNVLNPDGRSYHQTLTNEFSLSNLLPFTQPGAVYYVSIKAVGIDGLRSSFSVPVVWNLT